jgi:hypothetical protein
MLHYGKGCGEVVLTRDRRGIACLTNLDSRSVVYRVTDDPLKLLPLQRHPHSAVLTELNPLTLIVSPHQATLDRPHGVPLYRSVPFVARALRLMENATAQDWKRIGARKFHVNWEPSAGFVDPQGTLSAVVRSALKTDWDTMMSDTDPDTNRVRDIITTGKITVTTIGGDGEPVNLVEPARHFAEQVVCLTGLPGWMLGFHWSNTERLAQQQAELLTAQVEALRREVDPAIERVLEIWNGFTDRRHRVRHQWPEVNLHDLTEQAKARVWNAQALQTETDVAITMWQNGWLTQLEALQEVKPERAAVAHPMEAPAPVPGTVTTLPLPSPGT